MIGWGGEPPRNNDLTFGAAMLAFCLAYGCAEWYRVGGLIPPAHLLAPGLLAVAGAIAVYVMRGAR